MRYWESLGKSGVISPEIFMHEKDWTSSLHASQVENLPVISSCMLSVLVLSFFNDVYRSGLNQPDWLNLVNFFLTAGMLLIVAGAFLKRIPSRAVNFAALFSMLFIGSKVVAVTFVTSGIRPLEMALLCTATSLVFLSQRFAMVTLAILTVSWMLAASMQLSLISLLYSFAILMGANAICMLILDRRISAHIHVYKLERQIASFLSMCAYCKNIRDTTDNWISIEKYIISQEEGARVSHSICPACSEEVLKSMSIYENNGHK